MPTYEYRGQNEQGQPERGLIFGTSLEAVTQGLEGKGLKVMEIALAQSLGDPLQAAAPPEAAPTPEESNEKPKSELEPPLGQRSYMATSVWGPLVGQVPLKELAHFFRQLSTMLNAGVPIVSAFDTMTRQARSPKLKAILAETRTTVEAGRFISDTYQRYPEVFSPVIISLLRAGEEGGFLVDALSRIADYLDREIELRNLFKRVTFYPKLQVGASILIILGTNAILASMGKEAGLSSPLTEVTTWLWLGPLIVGTFLFFRVGLANPRIKYNWDLFLVHIPYIGQTAIQLSMAKFGRAFGALYAGGVSIPRCLELGADSCGNEFLRAKMHTATRKLQEGEDISPTLRSTGAFSPIVLDMIDTGERTGNLDDMLNRVAKFYEDEAGTRSTQTAQVTGVFIFLCVAVYIGFIVVQFWSGYAGMRGAG
ncbi:MAG: type II secretion system F family protein [Fimbriimonas sp.]